MLLLNVSDIHFSYPRCTTSADPDKRFRTLLLRDVRQVVQMLGGVDAILVTGDIAAVGAKEEYEAAYDWLMTLAKYSKCPSSRIYVVPGNHDVNRGISLSDPSIANAQNAVLNAMGAKRERELERQFRHSATGPVLLAPLTAYNDFAANFLCELWTPDKMYWIQSLPIDQHTNLRLHGLNSTLFSGVNGQRDKKGELYLSPLQTVLETVDNELNAVLCHHPPDWFLDADEVDDAIKENAILHFFGHKHLQRIEENKRYVRVSAGAVNPDRNEIGWQPGYNLLSLKVETGDSDKRELCIDSHIRDYQQSPAGFIARKDSDGSDVFRHRIKIPAIQKDALTDVVSHTVSTDAPIESPSRYEVEAILSEDNTRNLVLRFWKLASSQKKEIMSKLDLVTKEELSLPESQRFGKAWKRAAEQNLIAQLADEIAKRETKDDSKK